MAYNLLTTGVKNPPATHSRVISFITRAGEDLRSSQGLDTIKLTRANDMPERDWEHRDAIVDERLTLAVPFTGARACSVSYTSVSTCCRPNRCTSKSLMVAASWKKNTTVEDARCPSDSENFLLAPSQNSCIVPSHVKACINLSRM